MPFKTHLLIIGCIVIVMFGVWQWKLNATPAPVVVDSETADLFIRIERASYGLNCKDQSADVMNNDPASASNESLRENNVLLPISSLCNGKISCSLAPALDLARYVSAVKCSVKILEVDYRCSTYDRLRTSQSKQAEKFIINCSDKR